MTRKDYVLIASMIRGVRETESTIDSGQPGVQVLDIMADRFADELACDNPRFNRSRFMLACGVAK